MKTIEIKNSKGEVMHSLKLEDNYTVMVENGVTVVEAKYVPKVGDYFKTKSTIAYCDELVGKNPKCVSVYIDVDVNKLNTETGCKNITFMANNNTFTKITPEELQAEFNKLGYEYDFETHTAKKMEWKPKEDDEVWSINEVEYTVESFKWRIGFELGLLDFRTKELAEAALETLKNSPHA